MRVTKVIREYITEQVKAKFPITEEEKFYQEFNKTVNKKAEELQEKVKKYQAELAKQANRELGIEDWENDDVLHFCSTSYIFPVIGYNNPYIQKARKAEQERKEKINKTIRDIIITLELGGTKADLDKMLAEVGE